MNPIIEAMLIVIAWLFFIGVAAMVVTGIAFVLIAAYEPLGKKLDARHERKRILSRHMAGDHLGELKLRETMRNERADGTDYVYFCEVCKYRHVNFQEDVLMSNQRWQRDNVPKVLS